jgi:hypothetical protein
VDMGSTPIISTIHSGKTAKRSLKGYQDSGWLSSILLTWCLGVSLNPVGKLWLSPAYKNLEYATTYSNIRAEFKGLGAWLFLKTPSFTQKAYFPACLGLWKPYVPVSYHHKASSLV